MSLPTTQPRLRASAKGQLGFVAVWLNLLLSLFGLAIFPWGLVGDTEAAWVAVFSYWLCVGLLAKRRWMALSWGDVAFIAFAQIGTVALFLRLVPR